MELQRMRLADGAVCLAERGGLGGWDGYDVSVSIVASSRFGNNEVWVWVVGLGWETMIVSGESAGWVEMIETDWVGWLGMTGMLYVVD